MAKLKEIRESSPKWMTTSFIDMISNIDKSKTNKYVTMITRIVENNMNERMSNWDRYEVEHMREVLNIWGIDSTKLSDFECFYYRSILDMVQNSDRDTLIEFMKLYENNSFKGVDVNTIKSIEEINSLVSIFNLNTIDKKFAKQIHIDLENDEWLIMRPLTAESSFKYGAGTKWCTTSKNNPDHYFRYTEDSTLVYCLNKITGYKVACLIRHDKSRNVSFWNSIDDHIDSINTELSPEVFELIRKIHWDPELKTNKELGGEHWIESFEQYKSEEYKVSEYNPIPMVAEDRIDETVHLHRGVRVELEPNVIDNEPYEMMADL